ncbi:hypothetical protein [Shewanella chilikensis]|uniref:hypothetical protein n=1 Tax=Shewanella chilikensis TaxID=558541 RepID=UPI00399B80F6
MEEQEFILEASENIKKKIKKFGKKPKARITFFIDEFQRGGFAAIDNVVINGYKVRNKASDEVPKDDPEWLTKVKLAQDNNLWHFHLGFYDIDCDIDGYCISNKGDLTSQWVIHYQKLSDHHIHMVDITPHPPFNLPDEKHLRASIDTSKPADKC